MCGARIRAGWGQGRTDRPPSFVNTNRNKRSITLNLKTKSALAVTKRLATVADVIVENFSAGVMGRLAKRAGVVGRAIDAAGLRGVKVAPAAQ